MGTYVKINLYKCMNIIEIIIGSLAIISTIGAIVLAAVGVDYSFLLPIITALLGWLIGKKNDLIVGAFKK